MRMICLVNHGTKSVTVYSLCVRHKHNLFIEEEIVPVDDDIYSLTHYDINMSWRRFKKKIQKKGFTFFPSLKHVH